MDKISFDSTEVAFRIKSRTELRRAYFLFRAISNRGLVSLGGFLSRMAIRLGSPIGWIVKPTIYSHFCGGENIEDCLPTVDKLASFGVNSVLDYSVEGGEDPEAMESALEETLRTVINAKGHEHIPFTVFKPTAFCRNTVLVKQSMKETLSPGEKIEAGRFRERVDRLCKTACEHDVRIMIDAEDYAYQAFIDEVVTEMMEKYNREKAIVFNTYQIHKRLWREDMDAKAGGSS